MKKRLKLLPKIFFIFFSVLLIAFGVLSIVPIKTTMVNHRGYSKKAPENTLSAYKLSYEKGYKYVECDVDFTLDGVPVLLHDGIIDRTSNATGNINIRDITYAQALEYDFGYEDKFGNNYKGEKIPTFYEFISLCETYSLSPYIELKGGTHRFTDEQIKLLINTVKSSSIKEYTFISFSYSLLEKVKNYDDTARLGYVINKIENNDLEKAIKLKTNNNSVFINANFGYLTPKKIKSVRNAGLGLEVWTVNFRAVCVILSPFVDKITTDKVIYK